MFVTFTPDCGAVTTGPVTVPCVIALGVGVVASSPTANADNPLSAFGLVTMASLLPVTAVLLLALFLHEYKSPESIIEVCRLADAANPYGYVPLALQAEQELEMELASTRSQHVHEEAIHKQAISVSPCSIAPVDISHVDLSLDGISYETGANSFFPVPKAWKQLGPKQGHRQRHRHLLFPLQWQHSSRPLRLVSFMNTLILICAFLLMLVQSNAQSLPQCVPGTTFPLNGVCAPCAEASEVTGCDFIGYAEESIGSTETYTHSLVGVSTFQVWLFGAKGGDVHGTNTLANTAGGDGGHLSATLSVSGYASVTVVMGSAPILLHLPPPDECSGWFRL